MEDEEKKRAIKRLSVRIMLPEDKHPRIMEYFRRDLGEPNRMISMKNSVYVEVLEDTAGGCPLRHNNVVWRIGQKLRMQRIPACMNLDPIVQYVSVKLKLSSKKKGSHQLSPRKLHPLLEEKDLKNDGPKNCSFWTFAAHMTQIPPNKYNFNQFAAFFHFMFIKINYFFV